MRMSSLLASTVLASAMAVLVASPASAAPILFTWSPSAVGLTGGNITNANNFNVTDYATITVGAGGNFTESGALNISGFLNGGSSVASTGLGSTYSLYYTFTAAGNQGGPIPTVVGTSTTGTFSALNYTLWATPNATPTFTVSTAGVAIAGNAGAFALATGALTGGGNTVNLTLTGSGLSPTANVEVTVNPCLSAAAPCTANEGAFFVNPPALAQMFQFGNFSSTGTVTTFVSPNFVEINGGGGNITEAVPEPVTLSIFGAGLVGAAALRRRKAKKA